MTKPNPVVEALELAAEIDHQCLIQDAAWLRKKAKEALPLARSMVEKLERYDELVEALEWILEHPSVRQSIKSLTWYPIDCPAIIERMIGGGK